MKEVIIITRENNVSNYLIEKISKSHKIKAIFYEQTFINNRKLLVKKISKHRMNPIKMVDLIFGIAISQVSNFLVEQHFKDYTIKAHIKKFYFDNISHDDVEKEITKINHDAIIVFGTSIIRGSLINSNRAIFNIHMGNTSKYRGSKSEFWAAWNGNLEDVGFTLHLLDRGIDTGAQIDFVSAGLTSYLPVYQMRQINLEKLGAWIPYGLHQLSKKNLGSASKVGDLYTTPGFAVCMRYFVKLFYEGIKKIV